MAMTRRLAAFILLLASSVKVRAENFDCAALPDETLFPGPWERYIKAPADKARITPARILATFGNVTTSSATPRAITPGDHVPGQGILIGPEGLLTLEFDENIGGRVCFDVESVGDDPELYLSYSESPLFSGKLPDATTDRSHGDLPLQIEFGTQTGVVCVGKDFVRGGFKYLTIRMPVYPVLGSGPAPFPHRDVLPGQHVLSPGAERRKSDRDPYATPWVSIRNLWVDCTAYPSQAQGRAYSGYFFSSSNLLNRIWYAGAYTLQLSTLDPGEGSSMIDYNRLVDDNESPAGSWYSNFTIANGTTVITDGAKRNRIVSPIDLLLATPGIAVSTRDMLAVRNALDALFAHQYADASLPRAGPPFGFHGEFLDTHHLQALLSVHAYVKFSGDMTWLTRRWPAYLCAVNVSVAKIDNDTNLLPGPEGHSLEASALLSVVLDKTITLARWLGDDNDDNLWTAARAALHKGIQSLYCPTTRLHAANLVESHRCPDPDHLAPQAGNAWALVAGAAHPSSSVSRALSARWLPAGAPAPETPRLLSPLASSIELAAHAAAHRPDAAVVLILRHWGHLLDGPGFTNSTLAAGVAVDSRGRARPPEDARTSHCRAGAAGPTGFLTEHVLGAVVAAPGGGAWTVRPRLTPWLGWVRGGFATGRGLFEVRVARVVAVDRRGDVIRGGGQVVEMTAPEGTVGGFVWDDDQPEIEFRGGKTVAFIVREDRVGSAPPVEELDVSPGRRSEADCEEEWYLQVFLYRNDMRLVYDKAFTVLS
ncbi:hypothetical protein BN1708_001321 [Verticillium longisporum]|uniref:Alpha-L-rhamnosidase six-hairpin glycosidase domain-containing protein n=1 Tax=Verticillium longisporum TaxID=100787 RepID=A0A0G4MNA9_VERLO|nr:hypothetical protein BN1708_001321 [Verticillium longisporum]